jgi:hypothetical protein
VVTLQHRHAGLLQIAKQSRAIGAGTLNAHPGKLAERAHPYQHLPVAVPRGRETCAVQDAVMFVNHGPDMQILVRINAAHDAAQAGSSLFYFHTASLQFTMMVQAASPASNTSTRQ